LGLGFDHSYFGAFGRLGFAAGSQPFLIALLGLSCVDAGAPALSPARVEPSPRYLVASIVKTIA
jgi:hypothetical protein